MSNSYYDPGPPLRSPLDLLKFECPVCGALYWRNKKAANCCKGTPEYNAWRRHIDRQVAAAEAKKHGHQGTFFSVGQGMKPCPLCSGEPGNVRCPLCDGDGFVPENMP